ncbi:MAG TPA: NrfD/PsrC family molybdoenzyme membrane anchor subunit [Rhodanobacteraceae bacterium]|nr:NrfD/PsrC family molybdoenzyme membrane anchor subunit [Rhodanobacteraceae bacterium]
MSARAPTVRDDALLGAGETLQSVTDTIADRALDRPPSRPWLALFLVALGLTGLFMVSIAWLLLRGVGIWGINIPVAWAFAIANYVWWIAIGMGGTFISAALYIIGKDWRSSINRYAEAMTVFAVSVSGVFPILHLGRPEFFYWLFAYPNKMTLWPQWRSSLFWDFCAILAYLIFSILYWYAGLIPDLASLRDRARSRGKQLFYGVLALGWRGEARHWAHLEALMLVMAGLAVPLVFSVHSMVGLDFSEGLLPGWHSTIFPPYFVAGALFSGFAMVLVLGITLRRWYGLGAYITERHLDNLARLVLTMSLIMAYSYLAEIFTSFYSGDPFEIGQSMARFTGAYAWVYWLVIACNVLVPQLLWWPRLRRSHALLLLVGLTVLVGMWFERFMLIVDTLYRSYLPSMWGMFYPTFWDLAMLFGSVGLFLFLFLLFARWLPVISMHELRKLVHKRATRVVAEEGT